MSTQVFDRTISIQYLPFVEEQDKTKQLQAGQFLHPGFVRLYDPSYRLVAGKNRYFTGLEASEFPETEREEIIKAKEEFENFFGKGELEPTNDAFWSKRQLEINKKTTFLNLANPADKLTYYMIRGGGYKEVAPNYEIATSGAIPYRWYLIDAKEFADIDVQDDRKINKAIAALEAIDEDKKLEDLFLVHKVLISSDRGVTLRSPRSMMYKDLSNFIHGTVVKTNKKQTAKQFLEAAELLKKDKKLLYLTAYVKEGNYFNFLNTSEDNQIRNAQTGTKYGSSTEKAVKFLSSPANQTELDNLKEQVEKKWNE